MTDPLRAILWTTPDQLAAMEKRIKAQISDLGKRLEQKMTEATDRLGAALEGIRGDEAQQKAQIERLQAAFDDVNAKLDEALADQGAKVEAAITEAVADARSEFNAALEPFVAQAEALDASIPAEPTPDPTPTPEPPAA